MIPETAAEIIKKIGDLLLLRNEETRQRNLLAIFGLFHTDFSKPILVSYDENGVLVVCPQFGGVCTCQQDPKFPKTHRIPNDPELHSSRCDVYRSYALAMHECLRDVTYAKDQKGQDTICFDFFWPRTLTTKMRNVLVTAFPEIQADSLWANFTKGWERIMKFLPEPPAPWNERMGGTESEAPAEKAPVPTTPNMAMDFDLDLDVATPGPELKTEAVKQPPLEEVIKETTAKRKGGRKKKEETEKTAEQAAPSTVEIETEANPSAGEQQPVVEMEVVSTTPIPEEGSVNTNVEDAPAPAKAAENAPPTGKEPKDGKGKKKAEGKDAKEKTVKKIDPAREKFVTLIRDELSGISNAIAFIEETEGFPVEAVKNLKARFDRLALKTAHLIYRGRHDADAPGVINPMVEVTLANISGTVNGAVRDLGLAPEKVNSWVDFKKEIKSAMETADSMAEIMAQIGMADVVQPPPKLKDREGNALVP